MLEHKVQEVLKGFKDPLVIPALKEVKEFKEFKDHKVL
jgi:hypothetical protein